MNSQKYATKLLKEFNDNILKCKSIEDYASLVLGVFVFNELVIANFNDFSNNSIDDLNYMISAAKEIANEAMAIQNTNIN